MPVTAFAFPNVEGSAPITVTADAPVLNVFKPVAEAALADAFGNPVNGVVILNKVILNGCHFDKPGFSCVVDERCVASPAEGIVVLKLGCGEKLAFAVKVNKNFGVSILNKHARIGSFICHVALAVNKLDKGQIIGSANLCVVLTESGSDVNDARTVGHGNIVVNGNKVSLFILLLCNLACACKQGLVFLAFKVCADIGFKDFIGRNAVFLVAE